MPSQAKSRWTPLTPVVPAFAVTVSSLTAPYLTATATDAEDGTSEFSAVFTATVSGASPAGPVYLPIILRNASFLSLRQVLACAGK